MRKLLLASTALVGMVALSAPAFAASFTVTNSNDSGAGSLRQAITDANGVAGPNTITLQAGLSPIALASNLPLVATSVNIVGNGNTIDGGSTYRGFLISGVAPNGIDAAATTVSISNLTIQNVKAKGGDGGSPGGGGGGLGAGGAVFVGPAANVTLSNVAVTNTAAVGGNGGARAGGSVAGGGGLGGNGGANNGGLSGGGGGILFSGGAGQGGLSSGGGGGITSPGADGVGSSGGNGGAGLNGLGGGGGGSASLGGTAGAAGGTGAGAGTTNSAGGKGGSGGFGGGGGGGGDENGTTSGNGGFGGGGGGRAGTQGNGGYGGGGGAQFDPGGGNGGFGGGGGANDFFLQPASGGFAGGRGASPSGGGGGGGLGGAIFVASGGALTIDGNSSQINGTVQGGNAGTPGNLNSNGLAYGAGIFFQGSASGAPSTLNFGAGNQAVVNEIADQNGSGGAAVSNGLGGTGGATALAKTGPGTLTLSAANTYTGGTIFTGGTVAVSSDANLGAASGGLAFNGGALETIASFSSARGVTINGVGTLQTDGGVVTTLSGVIADGGGGGALTKTGTGTLVLTAANTYTGGTTISTGTLQLGNGGATGSIVGDVTNNAALAFNRSDAATFAGKISGAGSVKQIGAGTTTLSAANTYTGGTIFTGGTVAVSSDANLGAGSGGLTFNGGALETTASFSSARGVTINGVGTLQTDSGVATTLSGVIADGGAGALTKTGTGTLVLTAVNTYTGVTTISAGTLQLGSGGATGSIVGDVINSAALTFNRSNALTFAGKISGAGAVNQVGAGTTILTGVNTYTGGTMITGGTLQLGNGGTIGSIVGNVTDNATLAFNRSDSPIFGGIISGSGGVNQIGSGTTILTGANTYTGGTTISAGTLQLGNGGATGSIVGDVTNNASLAFNRSDAATFAGKISGSGSVKQIGAGTTTLTGANTYTGATTVTAGTLAIAAGGSVASNVTNSATFNNAGTVGGRLTNTAGATTNAGTLNGGATISGGTLTTTGTINAGLANAATVIANGGAMNGAIANSAGTFNVGGVVTSDGTFANANGAVLAIGSAGDYTLQGLLTNSGSLTVASGGQLTATAGGITNNATGTINVAAGGTVRDDLNNAGAVSNNGAYFANVASNSGTISNTASGAWTGNVASNGGTITNAGLWTGSVTANTGTLTNSKAWIGTVANAGTFNNAAGATVSGKLTNTAGTTANDGALNGGASLTGGTLTGAGAVAGLNVTGGTLAPGNTAPGSSMSVTGPLTLSSAASYLVQINSTAATFANVTGSATPGGATVNAIFAGSVSSRYTILSATGGVNGVFNPTISSNLSPNFKASLSYDPTHAYIDLALNFVQPAGGFNQNQQRVANIASDFFSRTGSIPVAFGALTPAGLTQATGELPTAAQQTTFDAMGLFMGLMTPFVAGRGDPVSAGASASQFAQDSEASAYAASGKSRTTNERDAYAAIYRKAPPPMSDPFNQRWSTWTAGYGGSQTTQGEFAVLGSNNTRSSIGGVAVGADYRFSANTLAGFALAGGGTSFNVSGLGSGRSDLFQAGAFIRHNNGPAYITGALAYGWQNITTDRAVTVAGTDLLHANFNANAYSGRIEGGYRFVTPWTGGIGITPYAAGQFTTFDLPAYAEQVVAGASTFALSYMAKSVTDTRSELGIRSDKSFAMQNGIFTLRGRAAWAHDFNPDRNIGATFQTLPGASFVVNGATHASDSALVTGSAEMKWPNGFSLAATFEGEFSDVTRSYAGKGVLRYTW
jgi:autotransporter-associated beta strand protein